MPENRPMDYKKPSSRIAGSVLTATERARKNRAQQRARANTLAETRRRYATADANRSLDAGGTRRVEGQSNPTYESIKTNDRPGETRLLKDKVSKNSVSKAPTPQPEPEKPAYQKKSK